MNTVTWQRIDDILFRLNILILAAEMDTVRGYGETLLKGLAAFKEKLADAAEFFRLLGKSDDGESAGKHSSMVFQDIAFQGNILLFFLRGEISDEKLGSCLTNEQKSSFETVCVDIHAFIQSAAKCGVQGDFNMLSELLNPIHKALFGLAETLGERGNAISYIAREIKGFAEGIGMIKL